MILPFLSISLAIIPSSLLGSTTKSVVEFRSDWFNWVALKEMNDQTDQSDKSDPNDQIGRNKFIRQQFDHSGEFIDGKVDRML